MAYTDAPNNRTMEAVLIQPPKIELEKIHLGDCISIMREKLVAGSVDMIYADPPYNASHVSLSLENNKTGGAYHKINESWDRFEENDYWDFTNKWITESFRVLKSSGNLFVACSMHNIAEVIVCAKRLGLKHNNIFVWRKVNAMPNITKRTFTHTTEYTCWFSKGKGWTYNYFDLKKLNPERKKDGELKQMPDFISLPLVQGRERLCYGESKKAFHPAQKPEKLIEVFIMAGSQREGVVLDPFIGSGTTAVVAERTGRRWIGIEMEKKFLLAAKKRICAARK